MFSGLYDPQCPVLCIAPKSGAGDICGGNRKGKEMEERRKKREKGGWRGKVLVERRNKN